MLLSTMILSISCLTSTSYTKQSANALLYPPQFISGGDFGGGDFIGGDVGGGGFF
jgi:hypothetical protein